MMSGRKTTLLMALVLCVFLWTAPAAPTSAEADDVEKAVSTEDITLEDYAQQLFPGRALTEGEAEASEVLYSYFQDVLAFERRAEAADTGDLKQVRDLLREEELLEDELDAYEDTLDASYRASTLTRESYRVFDDELERLDDRLDRIEDMLEQYWDD